MSLQRLCPEEYTVPMAKKKQAKISKPKQGAWFIHIRGSYLPVNAAGWWTYLPFLAYLILSCVVTVKVMGFTAYSVALVVLDWVAATAVMTYIASRKS
jgi:hypothetical protein